MMTRRGTVRGEPRTGDLHPHEIEPGYSVPANWDRELFEPWAVRKARRAAERATKTNGDGQ